MRKFLRFPRPTSLKPQRHVDEADEHRHFDQWSNHRRERHTRSYSKNRDGYGDRQLEIPVDAQRLLWVGRVPPVGPPARDVAADTEAEHEDRDDERRGVDRVAEDVAEDADPDDLVDQSADAGEEEKKIEQNYSATSVINTFLKIFLLYMKPKLSNSEIEMIKIGSKLFRL